MILRKKLIWFKQYVFKPVFINIDRPKIIILIKQILQCSIFLSSQSYLKKEQGVFNESLLIIHKVTFILCFWFWSSFTYIYLKCIWKIFYDFIMSLVCAKMQWIPHLCVFYWFIIVKLKVNFSSILSD